MPLWCTSFGFYKLELRIHDGTIVIRITTLEFQLDLFAVIFGFGIVYLFLDEIVPFLSQYRWEII
jgi:hypothetical protein